MSAPSILIPPADADAEIPRLSQSALIVIDAQNTYTEGPLELAGVRPAIARAAEILERARALGAPVIHVQHDAGPGSLFDPAAESGAIVEALAPREGEPVVVKSRPNSFAGTDLREQLADGPGRLVLVGFMTHMCVSSTARAAFDLDYKTTVVAEATATRELPGVAGAVPAATVQAAALAALGDAFAFVVPGQDGIPD